MMLLMPTTREKKEKRRPNDAHVQTVTSAPQIDQLPCFEAVVAVVVSIDRWVSITGEVGGENAHMVGGGGGPYVPPP